MKSSCYLSTSTRVKRATLNLSPSGLRTSLSNSMADSAKTKDSAPNSTPPNQKTWVLRTSIHCEGCKKKVKKILHNTPGVHDSDVDLKLQKVTVTGKIDVNALIANLVKKTGKHAELWPEEKAEYLPEKQLRKPKPKLKPPPSPLNSQKVNVTPAAEETNKKKEDGVIPKIKPETKATVTRPPEHSTKEAVKQKHNENVKSPVVEQVKPQPEEKSEEDAASKETTDVRKETVEVKDNAVADGGAAGETVEGSVGKKKKKKGQNRKLKADPREGEDSSTDGTATKKQSFYHYAPNQNTTRQYPAQTYGPSGSYHTPPVYTVSYNTTPYPTSSYGTSYYATPPPHTEAYAYSASSSTQYQPSDYASYQSQPSDSFQIFSDENPNACSLM